jgi:hypothetical protein
MKYIKLTNLAVDIQKRYDPQTKPGVTRHTVAFSQSFLHVLYLNTFQQIIFIRSFNSNLLLHMVHISDIRLQKVGEMLRNNIK